MTKRMNWAAPAVLISAAVLAACQPVTTQGRYDPYNTGVYSGSGTVFRSSDGQVFSTRARRDAHERYLDAREREIYEAELARERQLARERLRGQGIRDQRRIDREARREAERRAEERRIRRNARRAEEQRLAEERRRRREADELARERADARDRRRAERDRRRAEEQRLAEERRRRRETDELAETQAEARERRRAERERRRAENARLERERLARQRAEDRRRVRRAAVRQQAGQEGVEEMYSRFRRPGESFAAFSARYAEAARRANNDGGSIADRLKQYGQRDSE